jgi:hypothetical protein
MGFEITYKFYEKAEKGYNVEEEKEFKAKVGEPFDEIALEQLAGSIMAQFARRDIMVFDAEVYELAKKQISFKESDGGIILKNKKYRFDKGTQLHCETVVENLPSIAMPHEAAEQLPTLAGEMRDISYAEKSTSPPALKVPRKLAGMTPIRYEIYNPERYLINEARIRGLQFTIGARYPIYQERPLGDTPAHGYSYVTADDKGNREVLHASHFQPEGGGLIGDFEEDVYREDGSGEMMMDIRA